MNISVNWLRDLVPGLQRDPQGLADRLSQVAVPVEKVVPVGTGLEGLRVARVLEARPHPNADRLTLCRVDAGGDPVDVVCGAPNVVEDALYAYVPPGAELPGGMKIEEREIRGETSRGMLCSEKELGLGRDAAGILRLDDDLRPGDDLVEALGLPDTRLVLELTPNRVDLACHVGVAREVAPGGTAELVLSRFGDGWEPDWREDEAAAELDGMAVRIDAPDRCERYLGAVIRGVEVGPSPAWLAMRLRAIGARPVNNVVDATNYVLHELNQPLHAFDLAKIAGPEIHVRAAERGERLRTLDGVERKLTPASTVIADAGGPVGLAGVMGGEESEVSSSTTDVFLECASFAPAAVRRTARAAELDTDASYRFERGIDREHLEDALIRCVELILAVAGGSAEPRALRVGEPPPEPRVLELRPTRVEQVLGRTFGAGELRRLLDPLGFEAWESVGTGARAALACQVPGWRGDVTREIDLVEEVARRHGYENFPSEDRAFRPSAVPDGRGWRQARRAQELLHARGLLEARSSSLVGREEADPRGAVELLHPLSAEEGFLRGTLVGVLLRRLEHNWAQGQRDVRLYEIGTTFRRTSGRVAGDGAGDGEEGAGGEAVLERRAVEFGEERRAGLVLHGRSRPEHWSGEVPAYDVWDLKGLAEAVASELCDAELHPVTGEEARELAARFAATGWIGAEAFGLTKEGVPVGIGGRVRPEAVDAPPWAGPVWALEFRLDGVRVDDRPDYVELSEYPPVLRDLAVTVPRSETSASVEATLREAAPELLEQVSLFDVYEGEGVEEGRRSLAFRFRFRAPDRTLEDREVEGAMERIVQSLEESHDARVRSG